MERFNFDSLKLLNSMEDGLYISDIEFNLIFVNKKMVEIFGDCKNKKCYEYFYSLKKPCNWCRNEKIFKGNITKNEYSFPEKNIVFDIVESCIIDKNGNISKLGIFRDITEKKRLQEQLLISEKISAVGKLAAGVAHEFNNIMAIIKLKNQINYVNIDDKEILSKNIQLIDEQVNRGAKIVSDILSFSKPAAVDLTMIDGICNIIDKAVNLLSEELKLNNIELERICLSRFKVQGDPVKLQQVFLNLLNNAKDAIKPIGEGFIKIIVDRDDKMVSIKISDNGIGMDEEELHRIFTPFYTTKGGMSKDNFAIQGTGLGLSIVYTIIKNHNGSINIKSRKNEGTTVEIKLPLYLNFCGDFSKIDNTNNIVIAGDVDYENLSILVVDDEDSILNAFSQLLSNMSFKNVLTSKDGKKAISIIEENKIDIVFLDVLMPGINGMEVVNILKKRNLYNGLEIILITGYPNNEVISFAEKESLMILRKPFEIEEIFNIINKKIEKNKK